MSFGVLGLWDESVDTLALTLAAVVLSLRSGSRWGSSPAATTDSRGSSAGPRRDADHADVRLLAPMALFFLIGPATAAIATLIYAIPPAIRITALGIRGVPDERRGGHLARLDRLADPAQGPAADGAARRSILGVNQTIMMALSMVVITALIDAPGLGKDIIRALQQVDVGAAFDAGIAIVIIAIIIDRLTDRPTGRSAPSAAEAAEGSAPAAKTHLIAGRLAAAGIVVGRVLLSPSPSSRGDRVLVPGLRQRDHELAQHECHGHHRGHQERRDVRVSSTRSRRS